MARPFISIIIPTHRRPAYLAETLESVFNQTFTDFEVIVVEDGTHGARDALTRHDDRVQYVWQPHRGVAAARNNGASRARGEWLALVDDDDLWQPEKLERQVARAEECREMGFLHTDHLALIGNQLRTPPRTPPREAVPSGWVRKELFLSNFVVTSSVMLRKQVFTQAGGFSETTRYASDYECWLRMSSLCQMGFVNEPLTVYRDHDQSLSSELNWNLGVVSLVKQFVRNTPDIYRECGTAKVKRHVRDVYWRAAYTHLIHQRYLTAARLFATAWSWTPLDPVPAFYASACLAGRWGVAAARILKHAVRA